MVTVYCVYVQCVRLFVARANDAYCRRSETWLELCGMQLYMNMLSSVGAFELISSANHVFGSTCKPPHVYVGFVVFFTWGGSINLE